MKNYFANEVKLSNNSIGYEIFRCAFTYANMELRILVFWLENANQKIWGYGPFDCESYYLFLKLSARKMLTAECFVS